MKHLCAVILGAALLSAGCASIQPARMAVPPTLKSTSEAVTIEGIGGWQRGSYRFADHAGSFSRSDKRLAFFDMLEMRSGHTNFTLAGPKISRQMEARCAMRERTMTISVVSFAPKKMAYACDFTTSGAPDPARFELQEVREGLGGALMKKERRGEISVGQARLQIRSIHELEGSPIRTATPMGYVFEQNGQAVGAVELNGAPRVFLPNGDNAAVRHAVMVASTALALFWDPANSPL